MAYNYGEVHIASTILNISGNLSDFIIILSWHGEKELALPLSFIGVSIFDNNIKL